MKPILRYGLLSLSGAWLVGAAHSGSTTPRVASKVEFNRDVRPIITKCFGCHGPDTGAGAAGLRLDAFDTAIVPLDSGKRAIVPGKPDESELIARIFANDESLMPPPESHKTLSPEEKETVRRWIAEGAVYKPHWAFIAPRKQVRPPVSDKAWPRNEIDFFVLNKLEESGLNPEPEANRETLIRRVSLDLTGLPPTPAEVDAFVADKGKNAYEKVVDRLLASSRFGERMAMDWMDYSRYADSNGYQSDYERYQSRWRDWVIDAFNKNMPYDQFTIEQIAGDLLPNATMEQKLATGFNRNHRINTEGGVIAEEWRVEGVIDRMETTSAIWLGLTAGCARCHDHKYDPLSQKDFYRMYSYYNNVPESGSGEEKPVNHPPLLRAPTAEQTKRIKSLDTQMAGLEASMSRKLVQNRGRAAEWAVDLEVPYVQSGLIKRFGFVPEREMVYKKFGDPVYGYGRATGSVTTTDTAYLDLGDFGDFESDESFSYGAWVRPDKSEGSMLSRMDTAKAYQGWECSLAGGMVQAHLISKWTEDAIKIVSKTQIPLKAWSHVFLTYDGSKKAEGLKMYIDGLPVDVTVPNDTLKGSIKTGVTVKVGRRTTGDFFNGQVDDVAVYGRALEPSEVATLASTHPALTLMKVPKEKRSAEQNKEIVRLWSIANDKEFAKIDAEHRKALRERETADKEVANVMVLEEMPEQRPAFVLLRGQYDKPGEKVEPGLPKFLPPMPKGARNNRLGFARWIVSRDNPLTARVTVNRLWERFFGTGIVATVEDFGTRAEYPSHPELLDSLAIQFLEFDWDLKAMIKEIVTSASYRQSSRLSAEKQEKDPENRLVSRGPRFRLAGEVIRDQALFASGLLVEKIGGPSVRPYQPEGIWDETNFYGNLRNYKHDKGDGLYRRSLYTIWKRTAAPPNMMLFDVPSREACRVRRARTDTPLQALTLLNDETYLEASRVLGERMVREGGDSARSRLSYGFRLVLCRRPTDKELDIMEAGLNARLKRFRENPADLFDLVSAGEARVPWSLDRAELAAYAVSASTFFNLDEAVTKE